MNVFRLLPATALCVLAACSGSKDADDGGDDGGDPGALRCDGDGQTIGASPMRRLTRREYNNTVRDLLGDASAPADAFAPDDRTIGFAVAGDVSVLEAQDYMNAAEAVAQTAVTDLDTLLLCEPTGDEDGCARQFIESFGPRAYRRPLATEEADELHALFVAGRDQFDFATGIELVVTAALQSPHFLYRVEIGMPDPGGADVVALRGPEIASRLSYLLWNTMPDDALMAAAQSGELDTAEGVEQHARRLLQAPEAKVAIANFERQWLAIEALPQLTKDPAVYPDFSPELAASMAQETQRFFEHVIFEGDGRLETLLTSNTSFVDDRLADLYGVAGPGGGFSRVDLDPGERAGLLTHASVLSMQAKANQTSPIHRGKFVRERLLCQDLPSPPNDAEIVPPAPDPNATTRERFAQHSADPSCAGCHALLDPLGFGFENYDGVGRYRTMEGDLPIDASGDIVATDDLDGSFDGVVDLAGRLAHSEEVRHCVSTQWFRYAFGRGETEDDQCTQDRIFEVFEAADYDIRELLIAITRTDAFRMRRTDLGEGA